MTEIGQTGVPLEQNPQLGGTPVVPDAQAVPAVAAARPRLPDVPLDASSAEMSHEQMQGPGGAAAVPSEDVTAQADSTGAKSGKRPAGTPADPNGAPTAPTDAAPPKRRKNTKKAKKPVKMLKLRIENKEAAPDFSPIHHEGTLECFWLRVQIREFLLRFDKLCRLQPRHLSWLNDPTKSWTDPIYKAVIVALLRLFSLDKTWLIPQAKPLLLTVEKTPAESAQLWTLVGDFLYEHDPYAHAAEKLDGEMYRLELVRRILVLSAATEAVRKTVSSDHEQLQQLRKENVDNIKLIHTQHAASLEKMKKDNKQIVYNEKKKLADKQVADKIFKEEQRLYNRLRKFSLRTSAVGSDNFGNVYWILQQKGRDQWGNCVVCEARVLPFDEERMVLQQKEPELDAEGKPKKVRRKYQVAKRDYLCEKKESTLHFVSGQQNLMVLAGWIRGQIGTKCEELATNLETMAYYCAE